ncbi:MAG: hypothetical protein EP343_07040 [Deltaproteobacteria bacterium]|nr:MAG: hypothetical protein EP343_07040 [Deltaproteobacteria bacterium]
MKWVCRLVVGVVCCCSLGSFASAQKSPSGLTLTKFKRAGIWHKRLAGSWTLSQKLAVQLHGKKERSKLTGLKFKLDTKALALIPKRYQKFLQKKRLVVAGLMTLITRKGAVPYGIPFVITLFNGETQVLFFLHRGKRKYGNPESFQVMMMTNEDKKKDILFVGDDLSVVNMLPFTRTR